MMLGTENHGPVNEARVEIGYKVWTAPQPRGKIKIQRQPHRQPQPSQQHPRLLSVRSAVMESTNAQFLRELHSDLSGKYKTHSKAIERIWRSLDGPRRAKC